MSDQMPEASNTSSLKDMQKDAKDKSRAYVEALRSGDPEKIEATKKEFDTASAAYNKAYEADKKQNQETAAETQRAKDAVKSDSQKKFEQGMKDAATGLKEGVEGAAKNAKPSASAARDVSANFTGRPTGNYDDAAAGMLKEAANQSDKQATQHSMEAQQHQQIANRNEFGEGDKKAVAAQAADVKNKINATGAVGAQAGLLRMQNLNPDYNREQERQDQQRTQAEQQREKSSAARKTGIAERGTAEGHLVASREYDNDLDESARLSEGNGGTGAEDGEGQQQQEEANKPEEQVQQEEQQQQQEEATPQQPAMDGYDFDTVQTAYNIYAGVGDPYKDKGPGGPRYTAERKAEIEPKVNELAGKMKSDPDTAKRFGDWLPMARGKIAGKEGPYNAGIAENSGLAQKGGKDTMFEDDGTESDERLKDVRKPLSREFWEELAGYESPGKFKMPDDIVEHNKKLLSDARCKMILSAFESGEDLSDRDIEFLNSLQGNKFSFGGKDYDTGDMEDWDSSVLDGYAEHIKNYLYTYKPEAQSLDPGDEQLDPGQEHIGPMAQDIEQVNPACVKETPEGVKTVDTARLAMMNAGAIGDLARELKELKAVLGGL